MAGLESIPVRIVELTDAQALETSIVENLQRRDVHPLEEASGFAALLRLEESQYSIEQIAAKCAKSPAYVLVRIRLTELSPAVTEAFLKDAITAKVKQEFAAKTKAKDVKSAAPKPPAKAAKENKAA